MSQSVGRSVGVAFRAAVLLLGSWCGMFPPPFRLRRRSVVWSARRTGECGTVDVVFYVDDPVRRSGLASFLFPLRRESIRVFL